MADVYSEFIEEINDIPVDLFVDTDVDYEKYISINKPDLSDDNETFIIFIKKIGFDSFNILVEYKVKDMVSEIKYFEKNISVILIIETIESLFDRCIKEYEFDN